MNENTPQKVVIVIPAFNEEKSIGDVLTTLPKTIDNHKVHIVVVNDCSTDNTANIVNNFPRVDLINHIINSGAGAATRTGIDYSREYLKATRVATMDADGQHSSEDVERLISYSIQNASDLVIGSRLISSKGMPWYKIIGNKGLSFITFLIFGVFVSDSQSGLKVFSEKAINSIRYQSNGFAFCSEIIWQAHKKHLTIKELPIKAIYTDYSMSKGQSNWNSINIISQMIKRRIMEFVNG